MVSDKEKTNKPQKFSNLVKNNCWILKYTPTLHCGQGTLFTFGSLSDMREGTASFCEHFFSADSANFMIKNPETSPRTAW